LLEVCSQPRQLRDGGRQVTLHKTGAFRVGLAAVLAGSTAFRLTTAAATGRKNNRRLATGSRPPWFGGRVTRAGGQRRDRLGGKEQDAQCDLMHVIQSIANGTRLGNGQMRAGRFCPSLEGAGSLKRSRQVRLHTF